MLLLGRRGLERKGPFVLFQEQDVVLHVAHGVLPLSLPLVEGARVDDVISGLQGPATGALRRFGWEEPLSVLPNRGVGENASYEACDHRVLVASDFAKPGSTV